MSSRGDTSLGTDCSPSSPASDYVDSGVGTDAQDTVATVPPGHNPLLRIIPVMQSSS
jgi:hypothetical protein